MEHKDLEKYIGQTVTVIVPLQRRVSLSIREILYSTAGIGGAGEEEIRYWLPGNPSVIFFSTDIDRIEISETHGIIIRLDR